MSEMTKRHQTRIMNKKEEKLKEKEKTRENLRIK